MKRSTVIRLIKHHTVRIAQADIDATNADNKTEFDAAIERARRHSAEALNLRAFLRSMDRDQNSSEMPEL